MGDRRAGPAGTEQHHVAERRAGQPTGEPVGEPGPVGVVADAAPAGEQDRVDRADRGRLGGQVVQARQDRLLARVSDVQPGEAHPPGLGEQRADVTGRHAEPIDVDQLVEIPQAEFVRLPLVQWWAQRGGDGRADQSDQEPAGVVGHTCLRHVTN